MSNGYTVEEAKHLEEGWFFYDHAWSLAHHLMSRFKGNTCLDVGCGTGLAIGLYGNQTKSIEDGVYTLYDLSGQNNIYKQYNLFEIRDNFDENLFEVRQDRGNQIDFTKQFSTIINP